MSQSGPDAPDLKIDTEAEGVEISSEYYYNTTGADYSAEGWTQGNGSLVPVDPEGTIYIYAAATGSAFKSAVQTLVAPARGTAPTLPTIDYKDESLSGTNTGMEYGIAMGQSVPSQWQGLLRRYVPDFFRLGRFGAGNGLFPHSGHG